VNNAASSDHSNNDSLIEDYVPPPPSQPDSNSYTENEDGYANQSQDVISTYHDYDDASLDIENHNNVEVDMEHVQPPPPRQPLQTEFHYQSDFDDDESVLDLDERGEDISQSHL